MQGTDYITPVQIVSLAHGFMQLLCNNLQRLLFGF